MERLDLSDNAARGALVSQLSREIVQLHARAYGRGPTKARSYLHDDFAVCVLEEVFTVAERTLIETGSGENVRETRQKFKNAVEEEFVEIVERITGRRVHVFLSQVDIEADLVLEFFLFEVEEGGEERLAAGVAEEKDLNRHVGLDVDDAEKGVDRSLGDLFDP